MKFSVLIPVYNTEKYLRQCLDSLLTQTYGDFEAILVDDGSTDSSGAICDEYAEKDSRFRVIHKENEGQLYTRLCGVKNAKGCYILFLDSDDMFTVGAFEFIAKKIEEYDEPDMVIFQYLFGQKEYTNKSKTLFEKETYLTGKENLTKYFASTTLLNSVWTKCVKRSVLDGQFPDYSEYKDIRISEDRLFSMSLVDNSETFLYLDRPLYLYTINDCSVSRAYSIENLNRFNIAALYPIERLYYEKWGIDVDKLNASYISYIIYVFKKAYLSVPKTKRKNIIDYNWQSFVPPEISNIDFSLSNEVQNKLWKLISEKNYADIGRFLFLQNAEKKLRAFKKRLIKRNKH